MSGCVVVTPTLGEGLWLNETVASVKSCAPGWRHVLVAPARSVGELSARFPTATVVMERGVGMYGAINAGLANAGDWRLFTYLNDDDLLLSEFEAIVQAASRGSTGATIYYGAVRLIDATGRRLGTIPVSPLPQLNRALYAERIEPVYQHGTVVTRAAWDRLGGFDETFRYCGDSEFLARACVQEVGFMRVRGSEVAAFRLRAGQLTKNRAAMLAERIRVDDKLGLREGSTWRKRCWARAMFRLANLPAYLERLARHGFVSFDQLLARIQ